MKLGFNQINKSFWSWLGFFLATISFVYAIFVHVTLYNSSRELNVSYTELFTLQETLIESKREIISIQDEYIKDLAEYINEKHKLDTTSIQSEGNPIECATPEDIVSVEVRIHNLLKYKKWDTQNDVMTDDIDTMILEVHKDYAGHVKVIFDKIYNAGFFINPYTTKGYTCRKTWFGKSYSMHSVGKAIDINATINSMIDEEGNILSGEKYNPENIGTIVEGGEVVRIFEEAGWLWMGHNFYTIKDYMHFSVKGR